MGWFGLAGVEIWLAWLGFEPLLACDSRVEVTLKRDNQGSFNKTNPSTSLCGWKRGLRGTPYRSQGNRLGDTESTVSPSRWVRLGSVVDGVVRWGCGLITVGRVA